MSDEVATRVLGVDRDVAQCDAHGADAEVLRVDELEESDDDGPPEITLDALSSDTLAALKAHLAVKDATQVRSFFQATKGAMRPNHGSTSTLQSSCSTNISQVPVLFHEASFFEPSPGTLETKMRPFIMQTVAGHI